MMMEMLWHDQMCDWNKCMADQLERERRRKERKKEGEERRC